MTNSVDEYIRNIKCAEKMVKHLLKHDSVPPESLITSMRQIYKHKHGATPKKDMLVKAIQRLLADGSIVDDDGKLSLTRFNK